MIKNYSKFFLWLYFFLRINKIVKPSYFEDLDINYFINISKIKSDNYRLTLFDELSKKNVNIKSILDFGCGAGVDIQIFTKIWKEITVYLYDNNTNLLFSAKRFNELIFKKNVKIIYNEKELDETFLSKKIDLFFSNQTLIYLKEKDLINLIKKIKINVSYMLIHELSFKENSFFKTTEYYHHNFEKIFKYLDLKYKLFNSQKPGYPWSEHGKIFIVYCKKD